MDLRPAPLKTLNAEELMLSNCGAGEDLKASWTGKRSNQLKEVNPKYSVEGMMLKLKLQHVGHLMQRANSPESSED